MEQSVSKKKRFGPLRTILGALGLSPAAVDEVTRLVRNFLSGEEAAEEPPPDETLPYYQRDDFLTPAEHSFFLTLGQAVADWALICPKVSLGDLFYTKTGDHSENQAYRNRISRKHVDFLLCDPRTARPLLGIELDDKSHQRADRQQRDEFVERVFSAAGLPLARVPVQYSYNTGQLAHSLQAQVGSARNGNQQVVEAEPSRSCPRCGAPMVRRTAKRGDNRGNEFWGCSNYPQCRAIVNDGDSPD
jgi:hypothetical protein